MNTTEHDKLVVQAFLSIVVIVTLCYGFVVGKVDTAAFMSVVGFATGFWFDSARRQLGARIGDLPLPNGKATTTVSGETVVTTKLEETKP